jgi:hypothetical protein
MAIMLCDIFPVPRWWAKTVSIVNSGICRTDTSIVTPSKSGGMLSGCMLLD